MRIIGGNKGGIVLHPPTNLPVRPTTDRAKESLFNILENRFNIEGLTVLDLFSGTGNISFEFCSRGASSVMSVDKDAGCITYIRSTAGKLGFTQLQTRRQDVFTFLKQCEDSFDFIFADAPYALDKMIQIPQIIQLGKLLNPGGMLVMEHASSLHTESIPGFQELRKYGQSSFSFFTFTG